MRLIELAQNAQRLFEKQNSREKRRLLNILVSNSSWRDHELTVTLRQPFDLIAETTAIAAKRKAAGDVSNDYSVIWGAEWDSNPRYSHGAAQLGRAPWALRAEVGRLHRPRRLESATEGLVELIEAAGREGRVPVLGEAEGHGSSNFVNALSPIGSVAVGPNSVRYRLETHT